MQGWGWFKINAFQITGLTQCYNRAYSQRYFVFFLLFVFSLCERKNEQQMKLKVPCCRRLKGVGAVTAGTGKKTPLSSSSAAKVDQMQENLIAYFRIFAGQPGATFVEEDLTWFVNVKDEPGNHVLRTRVSGNAIDRRIDEIIRQFRQYTDQIDWLVFPACRPADLGTRLESRGMQAGLGGTWMLADLTADPPSALAAPAGFHLQPVSDITMLEAWKQISAEGFGGDAQIYYDAYARHGFGPDAISLHYIGYLGAQPVTSSTLLLAGGIAGVYDVSTPPAHRRQGLAGAITFAMMQEARRRGYHDAWIWSSPIGKSVYRKLGFVAADFGVREYRWRKG